MDLILKRSELKNDGIFGNLLSFDGKQLFATLEHAYPVFNGFAPKLADGEYTCVRHPPLRLPYETFLVENVPWFNGQPVNGILIHCGNFDKDSEGCILVGTARVGDMVTESKVAFQKFMDMQTGLDSFKLVVK